jgi:O-acetylhomoserine (thiol)-lyase
MTERLPGLSTLAVHAGVRSDTDAGLNIPVYGTADFASGGKNALPELPAFGNISTRFGDPVTAVLEERIAALEGGTAAVAAASGPAALLMVFHTLLQPGDELIASRRLRDEAARAYKSFGWNVVEADSNDIATFERAVSPQTKAIIVESTTGDGAITDLEAVAEVARTANVPFIVDNTLATPCLLRPIDHGADIVVHSSSKILGGHRDSLGGILVDAGTFDWTASGRYPLLNAPRSDYHGITMQEAFGNFAFAMAVRVLALRDLGPAISPFNAFMILNGIETLALRMQRHADNAKAVAEWLSQHSAVSWVNYASLPGDHHHNLARKYMPKGAGTVLTLGLKGGHDAGARLVSNVKLFSHLAAIGETRSHITATSDAVRLSVGIEDKDDLIADLEQALAAPH